MEILRFRTNIHDREGVAKIAQYLDDPESISNWKVETDSKENLLIVAGVDLDPQVIENAVQKAGFQIELIRVAGTSGSDL